MEQERLMALEEPPAQRCGEVAVQGHARRDDAFWRAHEPQRRRQGFRMEADPVGRAVGNPRSQGAGLIERVSI